MPRRGIDAKTEMAESQAAKKGDGLITGLASEQGYGCDTTTNEAPVNTHSASYWS